MPLLNTLNPVTPKIIIVSSLLPLICREPLSIV